MKKQLLNIKHFVQDINLSTRSEKSDVLTTDLNNAEKKVELIKQACQLTEKKITGCLQSAGCGLDSGSLEKRYKKMPEMLVSQSFQELGEQLGSDTVLGQTLVDCAEIQKSVGQELAQYELEVERNCLAQLNSFLENDIPGVTKYRKQLNKATQDRDNYRQRYQAALKQAHQSSGSNAVVVAANKAQALKKELEESTSKVEQAKDVFAIELLSLLSREAEFARVYVEYIKEQASYHRKVAEILEQSVPQVEELILNTSQKPCFGTSLDEHLRVTEREIALVVETCIGWLLNNMNEEGLFRIPGSTSKVRKLKSSFDAGIFDIDEYARDPHTVAGCLKSYLRELPEPLLTHHLYPDWISAATISDLNARLQALWQVCSRLPKNNYANLRYIVKFLAKLTQNSAANKMSSQNIAIAMAPSLVWPKEVDGEEPTFGLNMTAANHHSVIVDALVCYADWFFPGDIEFVTLPIFPALINGDGDAASSNCASSTRTAPRPGKKPAPPTPPVVSTETDRSLERRSSLNNRLATLPRNPAKITKATDKNAKDSVTADENADMCEKSSYVTGSLDRRNMRNGENASQERRTGSISKATGNRSNRNSVEKPSVPPPSAPQSYQGVQSSASTPHKSERPLSAIERPSVPPPERPQRSTDVLKQRQGSMENICDADASSSCVSKLYPDLMGLDVSCDEEALKHNEKDLCDIEGSSNPSKDCISYADDSDEEDAKEPAPDTRVKNSLENDNISSLSPKDEENSIENTPQLVAKRSKPPRPQPPVIKNKSFENTYL